MTQPVVFMFPGQGAQYYEMGKELYQNHARFKLWMNYCDKFVTPLIGESIIDIIYGSTRRTKPFDRVLHSNPALLCIEYSLARILMENKVQPDYLLGYSLGEFTAAVVAGAIQLEQCLEFLVDYARLLESESPPAAMLAVLEKEELFHQQAEIFNGCWLTGSNFNGHFVVSGALANILRLEKLLNQNNFLTQRLPVNYGFHTEIMDALKSKYCDMAGRINFGPLSIPVISANAGLISTIDQNHLWSVIRYPVDFGKTIRSVLQDPLDYIFIDVGPSGTLSTFVKYLLPKGSGSVNYEIMNQYGKNLESLEILLSKYNKVKENVNAKEINQP